MRFRTFTTAAVIAAALVACADGQDPTIGDSPPTPTTEATVTSGPDASPTPEETSEPAGSAAQRIEVTVSGGEVDGPGTVAIVAGGQVELVVTSDVADEVHVHGYDIHQDVGAGETVTVAFTADIPGEFEVELEERETHLVTLQVRG